MEYNKEHLIAGVVIDGLYIKKDLFYYEIPPHLTDKALIGVKVVVPFGPRDEFRSGFLFSIEKSNIQKNLKEIKEISNSRIFDLETRDLLLFTAEKYFVPLHILINKVLKNFSLEIFRKYIICQDCEGLKSRLSNFSDKKRQISDFVLNRKIFPVSLLRRYFGESYGPVLRELEEEGVITRNTIVEKFSKRYLSINKPREYLNSVVESISDKKLRNAVVSVLGRLISAKSPVREDVAKKGIPYGRKAIDFLVSKSVVSERYSAESNVSTDKKYTMSVLCLGSLSERAKKIAKIIKHSSSNKTLIVFPELSTIEKVKDFYKTEFGESVFVWDGGSKRKLFEAIYWQNKTVILATAPALFVRIPNLSVLVVEDASSKYFENRNFLMFDVRTISIKKAQMEKLSLIFSTAVPTTEVYYLLDKGLAEKTVIHNKKVNHLLHIVDMRNEFKRHNYKVLSVAVQKKMRDVLNGGGNVALLLNRKSYSTFVMCRECGYVLRCPNCNVSLYYDKDRNKLFCPICGYETNPPDVCPRCGSPSIAYFAGGLQKLKEQILDLFPGFKIVELTSDIKSRDLLWRSSNYSKTIFIGTEYLLSHLTFEKIGLFAFVGIDIFLNHYGFNASEETFSLIAKSLLETKKGEVFVQTYVPDNFVFKAAKTMDCKKFFNEDLSLRSAMKYPPFLNLVVFTFSGKDVKEVNDLAKSFKDALEKILGKEVDIFGPSPSVIEKRKNLHFVEVMLKIKNLKKEVRDLFVKFSSESSRISISVSSYLASNEYVE